MFSAKFQTALLLLVAVSFSFSAALKCYNCKYVEGVTNDDCKHNLRDDLLKEVPPYTDARFSPSAKETAEMLQVLNRTSPKAAGDARQSHDSMCMTDTSKANGKETIVRTAIYGEGSLAGKCATNPSSGATTCWCDTDGCNNGYTDIGSGDGGGATATALNAALVIVGATLALFNVHA